MWDRCLFLTLVPHNLHYVHPCTQAISILTTRDIAFGQQQPDASASIAAAFAADGDDDEDDGYTAAVADLRIRFYLKVKQGPLLRYFNKGYEARWIYLVDQHILDFDDSSSSTPSRVYELKYPQAVVVRVSTLHAPCNLI